MQEPADTASPREAGPDPVAPSDPIIRPPSREGRSPRRTRRGRLRPWRTFLGSLIIVMLVAADCGGPWVAGVHVYPREASLSEGEPTILRAEVAGDAHPDDFCLIAGAVTWTTADPSVALVTETGTDDDRQFYDSECPSPFAVIRAVASGTTEIIATNDFDPSKRAYAAITVTDDLKLGSVAVVDGARATSVGDTLAVEVDVALYGMHDPQDAAVEWEVDDSAVVTTERDSLRELAPYLYRSTLELRGARPGVATARATHPREADLPWDPMRRPPQVLVTVASEAGVPFVVIRDEYRSVELGVSLCVTAYVGMPTDDPDRADASIDWSLTNPDVLTLVLTSETSDGQYPFDVEACMIPLAPGVTELVATSSTWPDASARVSIEVIE